MAENKRQRRGGNERRNGGGREGGESQGFTAFNMEDENEEGHFDEDGNFIWKKEEKRVQEEAWLDVVSEEQIEAAKSAKDRKDFRDEQEDENMTEDQANRLLASLLQPRETVLQALQRLGKKRAKPRGGNKRKQAGDDAKAAAGQTPEEKEQFERITEAADFLMRIGEVDVYSQMKEEFMSEEEVLAQRQQRQQEQREQQQQEQAAASAAARSSYFGGGSASGQQEPKSEETPPKEEVMWEYKGADGEIHGPFPTSTLIAWRQHGYFVGDNAVDMRIVSKPRQDEPAKKDEPKEEKPTISAEEELMNDFEDSDEEEQEESAKDTVAPSTEAQWQRSDGIDFASYQS